MPVQNIDFVSFSSAAMRKLQNNKEKFGEFPEVVFFNELMTSDAHWKIKEDLIDLWRYQTSVAGASCKNKHWDSIQVTMAK